VLDQAVERHLVDSLASLEEATERARVDDGAGEEMRAGQLSFLEDAPEIRERLGEVPVASPAGPAPTMRMPTSIRSSTGSVGAAT
jgi:hypothetical protein